MARKGKLPRAPRIDLHDDERLREWLNSPQQRELRERMREWANSPQQRELHERLRQRREQREIEELREALAEREAREREAREREEHVREEERRKRRPGAPQKLPSEQIERGRQILRETPNLTKKAAEKLLRDNGIKASHGTLLKHIIWPEFGKRERRVKN
jgi:hypothetical protein